METQTPTPFAENNIQLNQSLKTIFNDELNSMLCAITHLSKNLPEMADLAAFTNLRLAFEETQEETKNQIERIKQILEHFNIEESEKASLGIKCIIDEAYSAVSRTAEKSFKRDMALIFYAQIVEHVEIASYNILKAIASKLHYTKAGILLGENLDEAKDTKKLLQLISDEYILKKS
jgi:ferritin-like metal-binding protein YciE